MENDCMRACVHALQQQYQASAQLACEYVALEAALLGLWPVALIRNLTSTVPHSRLGHAGRQAAAARPPPATSGTPSGAAG